MKYSYTRALACLLLPALCSAQFICAAAANPAQAPDLYDSTLEASIENFEYHQFLLFKHPFHALIIQAATANEVQQLETHLLNPKNSLDEIDTRKGNTLFHLLAQCSAKLKIPQQDYINIKQNTECDLQLDRILTSLRKDQLQNRYQRKPAVITALCAALENRAHKKAIAIDPALGNPIIEIDGRTSFAPPYEWKQFANGIRMRKPTTMQNQLDLHIVDLPDDLLSDLFIRYDFNFSELLAFGSACKTTYFATMRLRARIAQKKYVLDILNIRNKAGKTALEEVQESRTQDGIDAHHEKLMAIENEPIIDETCIKLKQDLYTAEAEQFPIQQYVAAQLEQLEAKYMRMPGDIRCNPKPAPIPDSMHCIAS